MDMNNQWQQQQNMQPQYEVPQQNRKKGLSITSLILGIIAVILCCCFGWIPGLVGLILGIIALVKEPSGKGLAIPGVILSAISIVLSLGSILIGFQEGFMYSFVEEFKQGYEQGYDMGSNLVDDDEDDDDDYDDDDYYDEQHFWGSKYIASDDSVIYFYSDDTFEWFLTDYDYDNVKVGEYEVLFGEDAREWILEDHPEYGVTDEELEDYYDRNSDSDFYLPENLTILILTTDVAKMDGEQQNDEPYTVCYYGYSDERGFDGVNLNTFNSMILTNEY